MGQSNEEQGVEFAECFVLRIGPFPDRFFAEDGLSHQGKESSVWEKAFSDTAFLRVWVADLAAAEKLMETLNGHVSSDFRCA